jgi:hypothetical protein
MAYTSLIRQLADLRRIYTGQSPSQAIPAVGDAIRGLTQADRRMLVDLLRDQPDRPMSAGPRPVVSGEELRQALFPDALDVGQHELEAAILRAASEAVNHLHQRPPASLLRPAGVFRAVDLPRDPSVSLSLRLHPDALAPLVYGLLPGYRDGEVFGLPGLRYRQHRRCGELFLLDTPRPARVFLAGVDTQSWSAALILARSFFGSASEARRWPWTAPDRLTAREREHLGRHRRIPGNSRLGSALLRRILVLRDALWVTAWATGQRWNLEWPSGPSRPQIVRRLLHPLFGLAGFVVDDAAADCPLLVEAAARDRRQDRAAVSLRGASVPGPDSDDHVARFRSRRLVAAWAAWDGAINHASADLTRAPVTAVARASTRLAKQRASYTGETVHSAARGVTATSHGLDDCSPAQRDLRAMLALYLFNAGSIGAPPAWRHLHILTAYDLTISPRFDDLVIFTHAPDNVTCYLVSRAGRLAMPGMRLDARPNGGTFRLLHLPTGGRITITSRTETTLDRPDNGSTVDGWSTRDWMTPAVPLSTGERTELAAIPDRSPDMARLLAAIMVRISTADPQRRWALGTWNWDPLRRDQNTVHRGDAIRRLWGAADDWGMRWDPYPYHADVIASLTDSVIGLDGVRVVDEAPNYWIESGTARLEIGSWSTQPGRLSAAS